MRKTRGSDLKLGTELVHEASGETKANLEVFQLEGETGQRRGGRSWRRIEGSKKGRGQRRSEGRDTLEMNGNKEGKKR